MMNAAVINKIKSLKFISFLNIVIKSLAKIGLTKNNNPTQKISEKTKPTNGISLISTHLTIALNIFIQFFG